MKSVAMPTEPGALTLEEILSQPERWDVCLKKLADSGELQAASELARPDAEWVFVGCGTSYYLALASASTFSCLGLSARAVPASELLLYPSLALPQKRAFVPVMISRSGRTTEVVRASSLLKQRNVPTIAITCADGEALEAGSTVTLKLLDANDHSTVMTRSFSSMLLGLQYLGGLVAGNKEFQQALLALPRQVAPVLADTAPRLSAFASSHSFADCVFLAQGPLFGVASECMLKVTESSCTYSQVFHALEFRHGPKSIASPETLVTFLLSESSYKDEVEALEDIKKLGAVTMAIGNRVDERARNAADFVVELNLHVPEYARLAAYVLWGQLFGAYTGIKKGLNPDSPKNLTRVVELDNKA
jgi:glutamine---fructose-6-phosphate transaminase (isomerizing)